MLKSILVALDNTESGQVAQDLAINLAAAHQAKVTGLAILREPQPITPRDMLRRRVEERDPDKVAAKDARLHKIEEEAEKFAARCAERSVECVPVARSGQAYPHIARESQLHDLLIIGKDMDFPSRAKAEPGETVSLLLRSSVRPLIATPHNPPPGGESVLVAYDGSLPSARALQLFALLGLDEGRPIHVLSIDEDQEVADGLAGSAKTYLEHHGLKAEAIGRTEGHNNPTDVIAETAKSVKAALLVIGAFGHSGWRETLLGSSTAGLLRYARIPAFVSA